MLEWRSTVSRLLSNEWGSAEVSISVSQLAGFRPQAIPGAGAAFHTMVAAPSAAYHYTAVLALQISQRDWRPQPEQEGRMITAC